jgi:hypothetical protein
MAKADDKTSTKRIWFCQGWALLAKAAYGDLAEDVLTEALANGRVPSWDDSGRPIKPKFWRPKPVIDPARNSARQRQYRIMFLDPGGGPVTDSPYPPSCEHHGITLGYAEVLALLPEASIAGEAAGGRAAGTSVAADSAGRASRRGRPPEYDHDALRDAAETVAKRGLPDTKDLFFEKVRDECRERHIKVPEDTQLRRIVGPIYDREADSRSNSTKP